MTDEFFQLHEILGDEFLSMARERGLKDVPVVVWLTGPQAVTTSLILWDDRPVQEVYAPIDLLVEHVVETVELGLLSGRN